MEYVAADRWQMKGCLVHCSLLAVLYIPMDSRCSYTISHITQGLKLNAPS